MFNKAFTLYDFMFILFAIILAFITFFNLIKYNENNNILKYLTLTENAISKYSNDAIAFAEYNSLKKTTLQNTLQTIKIIDPIKKIEIYDYNNIIIKEIGEINCKNKFVISRLIIYNNEIGKAIFYFCNK